MAEVPVQPQPISKGINWKTVIVSAVVGGLVVGIGALGFYLYQGQSEDTTSTQVTTPKTTTDSTKQATPSAEKDETDDWKVHTDNVLGFQIKYPNDWFVDPAESWTEETQGDGGSVTDLTNFDKEKITKPGPLKEGQFKITIGKQTKDSGQSISDYAVSKRSECCPPITYEELETKKLGNFTVYKNISYYDDGSFNGIGGVTGYVEVNKTTVYVFSGFLARGQYESDLDLIISSFKPL